MQRNKLYTFNELSPSVRLEVIKHHRQTHGKKEFKSIIKKEVLKTLQTDLEAGSICFHHHLINRILYLGSTYNGSDLLTAFRRDLKGDELNELEEILKGHQIYFRTTFKEGANKDGYKIEVLTNSGTLIKKSLYKITSNRDFIGAINLEVLNGLTPYKLDLLIKFILLFVRRFIKLLEELEKKAFNYFNNTDGTEAAEFYKYALFTKHGAHVPLQFIT